MANLLRANRRWWSRSEFCAQLGGHSGDWPICPTRKASTRRSSGTASRPSVLQGQRHSLSLPEFFDTGGGTRPRHRRGHLCAGCPAHAQIIGAALVWLLGSDLPPKRHGAGAGPGLVRAVSAQGHAPREAPAQEFKRVPSGGGGPATCCWRRAWPVSARDARRLRGHVHRGNMPCTAASDRPARAGFRRQGSFRPRLRHRQQRPRSKSREFWKRCRTRRELSIDIACRPLCWAGGGWSELWTVAGSPIEPITRLEGHGKIEIFLAAGRGGARVFPGAPELRGFEKFAQGRPAETCRRSRRALRVCPMAHQWRRPKRWCALPGDAAARRPQDTRAGLIPPFYVEDHALHFYFLGGPDFVVGPQAPAADARAGRDRQSGNRNRAESNCHARKLRELMVLAAGKPPTRYSACPAASPSRSPPKMQRASVR